MAFIEKKMLWKLISIMLNYLLDTTAYRPKLENADGEDTFAAPRNDAHQSLPDDYALRGLIYADEYLPKKVFPKDFDEDEKFIEMSSMAESRVKRILWIGSKIARSRTIFGGIAKVYSHVSEPRKGRLPCLAAPKPSPPGMNLIPQHFTWNEESSENFPKLQSFYQASKFPLRHLDHIHLDHSAQ